MDLDDIVDFFDSLPVTMTNAIMFVVASLFAGVAYTIAVQQLIASGSPWYVWIVIVVAMGGIYLTEIRQVLGGGIVFSIVAGWLTFETHDYIDLGIVIGSWVLFFGLSYLRKKLEER